LAPQRKNPALLGSHQGLEDLQAEEDVRMSWLNSANRIAAAACFCAIGLLSLLPAEKVARTDLGGHVEHVLAYFVTAWFASVAFRERGLALITGSLCAYAACLEYLQRFSPGRNSSLEDFLFSASGIVAGVATYALLRKRLHGKAW
jgi:VanZ family protein